MSCTCAYRITAVIAVSDERLGVHRALRHDGDPLARPIPVGGLLKHLGQCHPLGLNLKLFDERM